MKKAPPFGGWVKHDGTCCPVDEEAMVNVLFRDQKEEQRSTSFPAEAWFWHADGTKDSSLWIWCEECPENDIVAYFVHGQQAAE